MIGAIVGGALGALAGSQGNNASGHSTATTSMSLRDINDLNKGRSSLEAAGDTASLDQFNQLLALVNAGPGASAVTDATGATNNYANLLQSYLSNGGAPTAGNVSTAQSYANSIFAPQQVSLNQQFNQDRIDSSRMAAKLGRPGNDPILANKLAFSQGQLQQQLDAQKTSFGAQYADTLQGRNLDLSNSLMNVKNGLAQQAFTNRSTLLQLGQQLVGSERNYRMGTATKTTDSTSSQTSGGGIGGAIAGGLAGFGTLAGASASMPSWSSMFSSAPKAPTATAGTSNLNTSVIS